MGGTYVLILTMAASNDSQATEDTLSALTPEQRAWLVHAEALWRRAHALAQAHPGHDPSDFYHALRCLELTPSERLWAGLGRG
jgi:uncharacterized protein YecT (DUF1311 family)